MKWRFRFTKQNKKKKHPQFHLIHNKKFTVFKIYWKYLVVAVVMVVHYLLVHFVLVGQYPHSYVACSMDIHC